MIWNKNPILFTKTLFGLKKANQRIATLAKKYGTDSDVFKNEVAFLEKEPARRYFRDPSSKDPITGKLDYFRTGAGPGGGKKRGEKKKKTAAKGNPKINIKAFNDDIRKGRLSRSEANQILLAAAGMKIDTTGEVNQVGAGITTVSALKKQARARLESYGEDPGKIMDLDIEREIKREAEIKNNFDTEYEEYIADVGIGKAKRRRVIKELFNKKDRRGKVLEKRKELTYADIQRITEEMRKHNQEKRNLAKNFEKKNKAKERR